HCAVVQKDIHTPVKIRPLLEEPRSAWDTGAFVREPPAHRHFTPGHAAPDFLMLDEGAHLRTYRQQRRCYRQDEGEFFRHIVEGPTLRLHTDADEGCESRNTCQDIRIVQPDNGDRAPEGYGHRRPWCRRVKLCDSTCEVNKIVLVVTVRMDKHGRIEWL